MTLPRARTLALFALLLAGLVNVHALTLNIRAHARFRESALATVRARAVGVRTALGERVALGVAPDPESVLRYAIAEGGWNAAEGFTIDGQRLAALPVPTEGKRWLTDREAEAVTAGAVLVGQDAVHDDVVAYALVTLAEGPMVLRLWTTAPPELAVNRREWEQMFLGHAAILLLLFLGGVLVLAPRRPVAEAAPPRALEAYEEAMERLRDQGEERTVRHEAERRQLEDVLRDKEALARAGELTSGIVHEVRNGLGTIVGYARLIENAGAGADAASARSIREECETLEAVIRRFVEFVKRETLSVGPVDLARMLTRVSERESRRPGPSVAVDAAAAGTILADDALLERAFENLVRNGREAAGAGGHVWVTALRDGGWVAVLVMDDGPGLTAETRAALRPFYTTKAGGLGLGLAITLKIVRLHDGHLELGERPPGGALVTVRLPVAGPAARPPGEGQRPGFSGST